MGLCLLKSNKLSKQNKKSVSKWCLKYFVERKLVCCGVNRPFSDSHGWTGSSMKWRLMRANLICVKRFARISLHFMLDPVQPWEFENGLFSNSVTRVHGWRLAIWQKGACLQCWGSILIPFRWLCQFSAVTDQSISHYTSLSVNTILKSTIMQTTAGLYHLQVRNYVEIYDIINS